MTITEFIEKAIERGWDRRNLYGDIVAYDGKDYANVADILLTPEVWKAVGFSEEVTVGLMKHLWGGGTVETYLAEL